MRKFYMENILKFQIIHEKAAEQILIWENKGQGKDNAHR